MYTSRQKRPTLFYCNKDKIVLYSVTQNMQGTCNEHNITWTKVKHKNLTSCVCVSTGYISEMQIFYSDESDIEALTLDAFQRCKKIKDHHKFVDIDKLSLADLPDHVRHPAVLSWVRFSAKYTVRILVSHPSLPDL